MNRENCVKKNRIKKWTNRLNYCFNIGLETQNWYLENGEKSALKIYTAQNYWLSYARDSINKSVTETDTEKNIYFEQVFYILMLSLLINQPLASVYFDQLLKYSIHSKLT